MPLVTKAPNGGYSAKLEVRISEHAKQYDWIKMLIDLDKKRWTMKMVMDTAISLLFEDWAQSQGKNPPVLVREESITSEIREMLQELHREQKRTLEVMQQAKNIQKLATEILQRAAAGDLTTTSQMDYAHALEDAATKMQILEGAANGGADLSEYTEEDLGEW